MKLLERFSKKTVESISAETKKKIEDGIEEYGPDLVKIAAIGIAVYHILKGGNAPKRETGITPSRVIINKYYYLSGGGRK